MDSSSNPILASVIIPVFNNKSTLSLCLEALTKTDFSSYEIVLVDDGSTEDIGTIAKKFPKVRFFRMEKNQGAAAARNHAISFARGNILLFTDGDVEVKPDWISKAVHCLKMQTEVDSNTAGFSGSFEIYGNFFQKADVFSLFGYNTFGVAQLRCSLITGNSALWRSAVQSVGCFDISLRAEEDRDLALRLIEKGYHIYYRPEIQVRHHPRRSSFFTLCYYNFSLGSRIGLHNEIQFKQHPWFMKLFLNAFLFWMLIPFISLIITLKIICFNFPRRKDVLLYAPLIFLTKICWRTGAWMWMIRQKKARCKKSCP